MLVVALAVVGCASTTRPGSGSKARPAAPAIDRDGPGLNPPPNLEQVPDAEPRLDPVRNTGPNKPYEVFGRSYSPVAGDPALTERGLASWYGRKFHGRPTSTGEIYDMYAMTAAHKTMPIPSYARVRNPANGREIIVRVNDRGPFHSGRVIDLSYTAALKLGVLNAVAMVEVERITRQAIRSGAWRNQALEPQTVAQAPGSAGSGADGKAAAAANHAPPSLAVPPVAVPPAAVPAAAIPVVAATAAAPPMAESAGPEPALNEPPSAETPSARGVVAASPGFWLQLGAFRERDGAFDFQRKVERELEWLAPLLAVFTDRELHRLQAGPYGSRADAMGAAERLRAALQLVPMIVERR